MAAVAILKNRNNVSFYISLSVFLIKLQIL